MDKNTLLLIFILFLLSSQLLSITWDIGKATIYIVIILLILNSISPETASTIKNMFSRVINLDSSLITSTLASVSKFILGLFFNNKANQIINIISEEAKIISAEVKFINEEANKPANKQAIKQAIKQADEPANEPANEPADKDAIPISLLPF